MAVRLNDTFTASSQMKTSTAIQVGAVLRIGEVALNATTGVETARSYGTFTLFAKVSGDSYFQPIGVVGESFPLCFPIHPSYVGMLIAVRCDSLTLAGGATTCPVKIDDALAV